MNEIKKHAYGPTVLIVEDNADMCRIISGILHVKGCNTIVSRSGEEALDMIKSSMPDIVSCDVQLGGKLSGLDFARQVRMDSGTADLFLIAISGYSDERSRRAALKAGFNMFFSKPVKFADLTSAIEAFDALTRTKY